MSDKRILIQEYDENPCLSCTNDCKKYPCKAKREWVLGAGIKCHEKKYKRSEAIEKIMRALCAQVYGPTCEKCEYKTKECKQHRMGYRTYAEAVLKSILEGHDDKR